MIKVLTYISCIQQTITIIDLRYKYNLLFEEDCLTRSLPMFECSFIKSTINQDDLPFCKGCLKTNLSSILAASQKVMRPNKAARHIFIMFNYNIFNISDIEFLNRIIFIFSCRLLAQAYLLERPIR